MHYINKSSLVKDIERRNVICKKVALDLRTQENINYYQGKVEAYEEVIKLLDTLDMKEFEEPSSTDRGIAEEIIINLKRIEQDYYIDLTREIEWLKTKVMKR